MMLLTSLMLGKNRSGQWTEEEEEETVRVCFIKVDETWAPCLAA
jgi:hypothetical protein